MKVSYEELASAWYAIAECFDVSLETPENDWRRLRVDSAFDKLLEHAGWTEDEWVAAVEAAWEDARSGAW